MDNNFVETNEPIEETTATPDETAASEPVAPETAAAPEPAVAPETAPPVQNEIAPVKKEKAFSKKKLKAIIAIVLVVALVAGGALGYFSYTSPKAIAKRFTIAVLQGGEINGGKYFAYDYYDSLLKDEDVTAEEYFEEMSEKYDEDITSWNDLLKVKRKQLDETWLDYVGKYKISAEATKETDLSTKKLKSEVGDWLITYLESYGLIDYDTFTAGKKVIVKAKIAGEDDMERITFTVYLAKAGGWKVIDWDKEYS